MVTDIKESEIKFNLGEIERVLPYPAFIRVRRDLMTRKGYLHIAEFARKNGKSKQAWSRHVARELNIVTAPDLNVCRIEGKVYLKKLTKN